LGGIPGLGNFCTRESIFERAYKEVPTVENPDNITPQEKVSVSVGELTLPEFYDTVKTIDQTVSVDYYLPGCPPPPDLLMNAVNAILSGNLPEKGTVLAPNKALCDTCPLNETKPDKLSINEIKRPWQIKVDPEKCYLEQGLICLGPVTRSGCGETCIKAGQACRGCFGAVDGVIDQGAKGLSMIASILGLEEEENMEDADVEQLINGFADPAGTLYRFSLATSLLKRKRME
jgi:F420-non-reducing hydrogenase small subunit